MILKFNKVEAVDSESRFVLKRTNLGSKELLNRKFAVNNQIFFYEKKRLAENKEVFSNTPYQTCHIFKDKYIGWDYTEIHEARAHADNQNRILIPFHQRSITEWEKLDWDSAETSFMNLATQGIQIVPYPIPYKANVTDWEAQKEIAKKKILPSQEIMLVLSTRHNEDTFQEFIRGEIKKSNLIGIQLYPSITPVDFLNLSRLRAINSSLKPNDICSLFVGFNAHRRIVKFDSVSSAFAYASFGIDVFSPYQMSQAMMKAMLQSNKAKAEEMLGWLYDKTQGGYSTNPDQEAWHGVGLIDLLKSKVTIDEELNKYQAIIWYSTLFEQQDFDELNGKILAKDDIMDFIKNEKSKWAVFWDKYGSTAVI